MKSYLLFLEPANKTLPVENVSAVGYFDALLRLDRAQADYAVFHFEFLFLRALVELDVGRLGRVGQRDILQENCGEKSLYLVVIQVLSHRPNLPAFSTILVPA